MYRLRDNSLEALVFLRVIETFENLANIEILAKCYRNDEKFHDQDVRDHVLLRRVTNYRSCILKRFKAFINCSTYQNTYMSKKYTML